MGKWINCKIYDLEYLKTKELTEEDLYNLFETPSLMYSLVISMFRHVKDSRRDWEIIKMCKTDERWMYSNFWTEEQKKSFTDELTKAYRNIYVYKEDKARNAADSFCFLYGLTIK